MNVGSVPPTKPKVELDRRQDLVILLPKEYMSIAFSFGGCGAGDSGPGMYHLQFSGIVHYVVPK